MAKAKHGEQSRYILLGWFAIMTVMSVPAYATQPNVLFIMVDDMGWNDVSYHGSDQILTPNIDALAYSGVILQRHYSEPMCTPTRSALLTGKYPMRLGMHGLPLYNAEDRGIPLTEKLLPSYMKDLGYATHLVGKWHVGLSRPEYLPTARGYDTFYGLKGGYIDYYSYNSAETWPNGTLLYGLDLFDDDVPQEDETRYVVDALTDRAVNIIQKHDGSKPLFLHLSHNAPHSGNVGGYLQPPLNSSFVNKHVANPDRRLYAELVRHLDLSIGTVVEALAEKGILNDTLIVFASDNGAPTVGLFNNWGVNLPLRGIKNSPWEGALRVPAFLWHSSIKPGIWDGFMHVTDWLPTLVAAVGGEFTSEIDGINQWDPIVQNSESRRKEFFTAMGDSSASSYATYINGDYKIVVGNLTATSNNYYGADYLTYRGEPPAYYPALKACEVARTFKKIGICLDLNEVESTRNATIIRQEDPATNSTLCVPTSTRGCLFNLRSDPEERHDLWDEANDIAAEFSNRLYNLWSMQTPRGTTDLQLAADPANFSYNWMPWIFGGSENIIS